MPTPLEIVPIVFYLGAYVITAAESRKKSSCHNWVTLFMLLVAQIFWMSGEKINHRIAMHCAICVLLGIIIANKFNLTRTIG